MMQSRTSFAIFLPEITCFLHLGLSEMPLIANDGAKGASAKYRDWRASSWNQVGEESTGPVWKGFG
ncbi:hypothetical protein [Ruegeria arenilitoris]|uniref:hypothetical protein n=1 Tax=Ruegeria arenilitoris TaxID=1173585 RepID=UPI001479F707|nr:hypothetical protein [Ruegeria arenilitoris]